MADVVASNCPVVSGPTDAELVIEDLQTVDKAAKLAALLNDKAIDSAEPDNESAAASSEEEVHKNGVVDNGDHSESQHNGSGQNGDATTEQTKSDDANPTEEAASSGATEESSTTEVELKPTEQSACPSDSVSDNRCAEQQTNEEGKTEQSTACPSSGDSETICQSSNSDCRARKCSVHGEPAGVDQPEVNKQMGELNVESEAAAKAASPAKKSCSPF